MGEVDNPENLSRYDFPVLSINEQGNFQMYWDIVHQNKSERRGNHVLNIALH
jgi:hypothetical protein